MPQGTTILLLLILGLGAVCYWVYTMPKVLYAFKVAFFVVSMAVVVWDGCRVFGIALP